MQRKSPCHYCPLAKEQTRTKCLENGCTKPMDYAEEIHDPTYNSTSDYAGGDSDLYKGPWLNPQRVEALSLLYDSSFFGSGKISSSIS